MHLDYTVTLADSTRTIYQILRTRLNFSRGALRRIKRVAGVMVNGQNVWLNTLAQTGDVIMVNFPEDIEQPVVPQAMILDILFEDEHLLVVNKPSNMLVHPLSYHRSDTLANGVVDHWLKQGKNYKFRTVSRLDKDTSGVLVIAKSSYVCHQLAQQLETKVYNREYLAIVHNPLAVLKGKIDLPIGRPVQGSLVFSVTLQGKQSLTFFEVVQSFAVGSLVKLRLATGRTHQIRVHMSHLGHPLMGDDLYGGSKEYIQRQALHCERLEFLHPVSGQNMCFTVKLPNDMAALVARFC